MPIQNKKAPVPVPAPPPWVVDELVKLRENARRAPEEDPLGFLREPDDRAHGYKRGEFPLIPHHNRLYLDDEIFVGDVLHALDGIPFGDYGRIFSHNLKMTLRQFKVQGGKEYQKYWVYRHENAVAPIGAGALVPTPYRKPYVCRVKPLPLP